MKKLYLIWTLLGLLFAPFAWAQNSVTCFKSTYGQLIYSLNKCINASADVFPIILIESLGVSSPIS